MRGTQQETHRAGVRKDQRDHGPTTERPGPGGGGGRAQPRASRVGRLLLPRSGQRYLPDDQYTRPVPVPHVVGRQAQSPQVRAVLVLESVAGTDLRAASASLGPLPVAACESVNLLREPDAGDPHVRFDERDVETEQGRDTQAPTTERVGNTLRSTYPTAPRLASTRPTGDRSKTKANDRHVASA